MLAPDTRAILLDALRPPADCQLDHAVATTFTLDLTAALLAPLAFAASNIGDSRDPIAVLETIRSCVAQVDIFCQAGDILVPRHASDLVAFIEPMTHQVRRPNSWSLFHPKVWFLRFISTTGDFRFRLLIPTRNLTLDRSWDVVLQLDDAGVRQRNHGNDQLVALIEALPAVTVGGLAPEREQAVLGLADDLRYVHWELPDDVNEIEFWAFGVGRRKSPDFNGYTHLIVSPFLTDGGLERILGNESTSDVTVVSRQESLDLVRPELLVDAKAFVFDPLMGGGEVEDDAFPELQPDGGLIAESSDIPAPAYEVSDLHAKMIVVERAKRSHVFIGSANASDAAFAGNVEILCELTGGGKRLGIAKLLDVEEGLGRLLHPYHRGTVQSQEPPGPSRIAGILRTLAETPLRATVSSAGDERWTVGLRSEFTSDRSDLQFTVAPLNRPGEQRELTCGQPIDVEFGPRISPDITAFFIFACTSETKSEESVEAVVRADLVGAPPGRLDEIIARQVDTPEKFLRFVLLLLGVAPDAILVQPGVRSNGSVPQTWLGAASGVFELLAGALSTRPAVIDDLAGLVAHLTATDAGRAILPAGWDVLWQSVLAARAELG